jgi:hypothetical protein
VLWGWDSVAATSALGDEKGITVPSVLCHRSVRGGTGACGVQRACLGKYESKKVSHCSGKMFAQKVRRIGSRSKNT